MFKNDNKASAKLSDNHLVLSLPDAMTPVVWMIDLNKSGSFFMRVDKDDNGLHILQKIEGTGKNVNIEDIAYYSDKKQAISAMNMIGKVLDKPTSKPSHQTGIASKILKFLGYLLILFLLFVALVIVVGGYDAYMRANHSNPATVTQSAPPPPTVESNPDAIGVPLSADDYLEQNRKLLPY